MTETMKPEDKPTHKPHYKPYRSRRNDIVFYVGGVAFLLGYLFGTGFFAFSIG